MTGVRGELVRPLVEAVQAHAARAGERTAFRDGRRGVTWEQLDRRTARIAGHLARLGVRHRDRVVFCLSNRVEMAESCLAAVRAGAVGVPLDPGAADGELAHVLRDSGAVAIVVEASVLERLARVATGQQSPRVVVVVGAQALPPGAPAGAVSYEELAGTDPGRPPYDGLGLDEPAWILYTSGTTGERKGVVTSQRAALWSTAAAYAPLLGMSEEDRLLWPLPMHHAYAYSLCILGVVATGASAYLLDRGVDVMEALEQQPLQGPFTMLAGVPATYHLLVSALREAPRAPGGLRLCVTAGAPCPVELRTSVEELLGAPLLDGYGSTETSGKIAVDRLDVPGPQRLPQPVPGVEVRVTDPLSGATATDGDEGEIRVRGPGVMIGYHGRPDSTAQVLRDGWYLTGDDALAQHFEGDRDVLEMRHPGVTSGDALPRDWQTLVDLHAATLWDELGDRRPVLLGWSMGGCPAHAVAARLAETGTPPAGLVLVDTYHVSPEREAEPWLLALPARAALAMGEGFDTAVEDMALAALGAYTRMLRGWSPEPVDVPTLLVRATDQLPEMRTHGSRETGSHAWRASWPQLSETVDVPGDHWTIAEEHAPTTARAIQAWVNGLGRPVD
ncbi:alpha/beta fold hydrolase [Streptomyces sp. NPDC048710]|uniref:alpha/beta fold hydrolase n=1 Tax=Streptomyces sp. NPDC048710 TaxID=3365586 RepID=UPI0037187F73